MNKKPEHNLYLLSPLFLLLVTQSAALVLGRYLGTLVFIPIILIYWTSITLILVKYGTANLRKWLKKPKGHWGWSVLAVVVGLSTLPLFISNRYVLWNAPVLIPHVIFFLINPWIEEFYWRGLLIDVSEKWNIWLSAIYSSVLFTVWHTAFAWYSTAVREISFYIPVITSGLLMVLIYKKTKSLLWCIVSHMLINILNLGIPVLMNLVEF